jgi:cell division protein FtsL
MGTRLVPYCLVALLALLVATYLVFMNSMTKKSFEIKRIESAVSDMRRENSRLEVEIAERESIATLSEQVAVLGMVPTEKIDYVTIGSGEVALR